MSARKPRSCKDAATTNKKRCLTVRKDKPDKEAYCNDLYKRSKQNCKAKQGIQKPASPKKPAISSPKKPIVASPKKPAISSPKKPVTSSPKKPVISSPKKPLEVVVEMDNLKALLNEYALHILSEGGKKQDVTMCPQAYYRESGNLQVGMRLFHSKDAISWKKSHTGIEYRLVIKPEPVRKPQTVIDQKEYKLLTEYASHLNPWPTQSALYTMQYDQIRGELQQYGKTYKLSDALEWERQGKPGIVQVEMTSKLAKELMARYIATKYSGMIGVNKNVSAETVKEKSTFNNPFGGKVLFPTTINFFKLTASIGDAISYFPYENKSYYYVLKESEQRPLMIWYEKMLNGNKGLLPGEYDFKKTYDPKTQILTTFKGKLYLKNAMEYFKNRLHVEFRLK